MEIATEDQKFYPGYYNGRLIPHGPFIEEWKEVDGLEGHYKISNYGRVMSMPKLHLKSYHGCLATHLKTKILRCSKQPLGYLRVHLRTPNIHTQESVHRLVALAFIPNPENKRDVNHIRGFTNDNIFTQLEWCTVRENRLHSIHFLKKASTRKKSIPKAWKPVIATNILTGEIKEYKAVKHAKEDGFTPHSISEVLKGGRPTHKGYKWTYKFKKHASK